VIPGLWRSKPPACCRHGYVRMPTPRASDARATCHRRIDGYHEAIRFDGLAIGNLDVHWTGYQHRFIRYHLHAGSFAASHGLSARITTSCSLRQPRGMRPVFSNQLAWAVSTGPKGTHCETTGSARKPVDRKASSDS
jgi:hypothetical protein